MNQFPTFEAPWWLKNSHAQTLWPSLFRPTIKLEEKWERVELPDGDFVDIVWDGAVVEERNRPLVVLLHGLGGSIRSHYIRGMMVALSANGFRPVLMHFRGASGVPNRLPRGYHSGNTPDLAFIVDKIKHENPNIPIYGVGYSLGGNVLLKWLGETGASNPLTAGVAVSVPFDLEAVANRLMTGVSRLYQDYLLKGMIREMKVKFKTMPCPFDYSRLDTMKTFWEFDDIVTAPLHGFKDVYDYYHRCASKQFLPKIETRSLIIHALDDPFMTPDIVPKPFEVGAKTQLILSKTGGHVGFVNGLFPGLGEYWLEKSVPEYLLNLNKERK